MSLLTSSLWGLALPFACQGFAEWNKWVKEILTLCCDYVQTGTDYDG